ncbi:hypothetical protein [Haemophilus haemolyticus]|uniref:hypothetical protein n=1 Tax=Haemophilus haemolyticus TaxID=726 RepID=UPI00186425F4|nr:hypothetical protein [Haemophilus haemolyticus]
MTNLANKSAQKWHLKYRYFRALWLQLKAQGCDDDADLIFPKMIDAADAVIYLARNAK